MRMEIEVKLEYPLVSGDSKQSNHLLVRFRSPANPVQEKRQSLVLGIAIDKSWSMKGEKISSVIDASCSLVHWLTRHDWVSVVAYSSDVQIVQQPTNLTEKTSITDKIRLIDVATATNLSGGWLTILNSVESIQVQNSYKRVILLTDGNPTLGVKEIDSLKEIAKQHYERGISTTVIGVGNDFNEKMMLEIAKAGGGNFYFIENPESCEEIFFEEFGDMGALFAQAMDWKMEFAPGISLAEVLNDYSFQKEETIHEFYGNASVSNRQSVNVSLGDMRSDDIKSVIFRIEIDPEIFKPTEPLFKGKLKFYNLLQNMRKEEIESEILIQSGKLDVKQDIDVFIEILIANAQRSLQEAGKLFGTGRLEEAGLIIFGVIRDLKLNQNMAPIAFSSLLQRLESIQSRIEESKSNASKHLFATLSDIQKSHLTADFSKGNFRKEIYIYETKGDIDLYTCPDLRSEIEKKLDEGYRFLIFDLSKTSYLDSSAIGTLIQIVGWLRKRGGEFVAANLKESVKRIFQISRLENHLRIVKSVPEANNLLQQLILSSEESD